MSKKAINSFKTRLIFSVMLIVSLIAVTVSASFSWFLFQNPNTAYDIKVDVTDTFNLKVLGGTQSGDEIGTNLDENFRLKPLYGDGNNFVVPIYEQREVVEGSGVYDNLPSGEYESVNDLEEYAFVLDFSLSVDGYVDLYLEYTDNDRNYVSEGEGSENRKSAYGDFSRDFIKGAIRVAIFQEDELKCVWIPNTQIELKNENGTYSVEQNGTVESSYSFLNENGENVIVETENKVNGNTIIDGITYVWGDITQNNCPKITTMVGASRFKVIMWIDGTDRECHNALVGGKVCMNLCFNAKLFGE